MRTKEFIIIMIFILAAGCVSAPPPKPDSGQSSILAISITIKQPLALFTSYPGCVYFIKIDEGSGILNQKVIIKSNYSRDDCVYLLNARPGRYAAVAAFEKDAEASGESENRPRDESSYNSFYFSADIIALSEVEVLPGEVSFMGAFTVDKPWSMSFSNPDEAQLYYCRLLQPHIIIDEKENSFFKITFGTLCGSSEYAIAVSSKEVKRDLESELEFLDKTSGFFSGGSAEKIVYKKRLASNSEWINIINKRIDKINRIKNLGEHENKWISIPEERGD